MGGKNSNEIDIVDSEDGYATARSDYFETEKDEYLRRREEEKEESSSNGNNIIIISNNNNNNENIKKSINSNGNINGCGNNMKRMRSNSSFDGYGDFDDVSELSSVDSNEDSSSSSGNSSNSDDDDDITNSNSDDDDNIINSDSNSSGSGSGSSDYDDDDDDDDYDYHHFNRTSNNKNNKNKNSQPKKRGRPSKRISLSKTSDEEYIPNKDIKQTTNNNSNNYYYYTNNKINGNNKTKGGRRPGRPAGQKKQQELQLSRNKSNNSDSKKQIYKDNYYRNSINNNNNMNYTTTANNNNNNNQRPTGKKKGIDENDISARDRAGQTNLHKACQSGNMERAKDLIGRGSDINARDHAGWTSLHEASLHGHVEIVYYLLENGADANAASLDDCDTPLHDACAKGHADVVRALLEYGADPDKANAKEEKPEDHSSDENIIILLKTPVEYVKTPEIILNYNSPQRYPSSLYITEEDFDGRRTSLISSKRGRPRIKQEDIIKDSGLSERSENPKPTRRGVRGKIREGDLHNNGARAIVSANDVLRMDLKSRDSSGRSNLHIHAKKGNAEMVANMIEAGAMINGTDNHGRTPLHEAASEGHNTTMEILLAFGADINVKDKKLNAPLHDAAHKGHIEVVKILLQNNAQPDGKNIDGKTPLDLARRRRDIVELLCEALDLNPKDYLVPTSCNNNNIIISDNSVGDVSSCNSRSSSASASSSRRSSRSSRSNNYNYNISSSNNNNNDNYDKRKITSKIKLESSDCEAMLIDDDDDGGDGDDDDDDDGNNSPQEFNKLAISPPRDSMEIQTPDYLRIEFADKYIGPLYTVQLDTTSTGYPLTTPTIPPTATLFVVDLQVELFLQWKVNSLTSSQPNLTRRLITTIEKERLWPLLRSIVWAPPKSIRPSEMGILEDARKLKFLEYQMYFVKYEEVLKLMENHFKNSFTKSISTMALDISDYPNLDVAHRHHYNDRNNNNHNHNQNHNHPYNHHQPDNNDNDNEKINGKNNLMELDEFSSKLPLTPTSPTTPLLASQWGVTITTNSSSLLIKKEQSFGNFRDNNNISNISNNRFNNNNSNNNSNNSFMPHKLEVKFGST